MDFRVILILFAEALFAIWLLYRAKLLKNPLYITIALLLVAIAFCSRFFVLDYETTDYTLFLSGWVEHFRQHDGFAALSGQFGNCNYNIPYLYFLALFSYSSINSLYLIKLLSIFFDVLLAWAVMLMVKRYTSGDARSLAAFFITLMLPTVFINSSVWAQCDSIYVALALLGIYFALDERPILSMALAALSFGFKLQAVFILPVYVVLWIYGKFNWKHFLVFPLTYIVLVLPAVLLGRPFIETLTLYIDQSGTVGNGLNYNSPSIYSFIQYSIPDWLSEYISPYDAAAAFAYQSSLPESFTEPLSTYGIIAAFVYMLACFFLCFVFRKHINERAVLSVAVLLVIGIPFLLPHMHERYFFAGDILTLVLAFVAPPYAAAALLAQFASLLGYHAYLKMRYLLLMDRGAAALVLVLIMAAVCFFSSLFGAGKNNFEKCENSG